MACIDLAILLPEQVAMIGDRLDTDVVGGQRAGLRTILVAERSDHRGRSQDVDQSAGRHRVRPGRGRWLFGWRWTAQSFLRAGNRAERSAGLYWLAWALETARRGTLQVTLVKLAVEAGVALSTASRRLSGRQGRQSSRCAAREDASRRDGLPDAAPSRPSLRTRSTGALGMVTPTSSTRSFRRSFRASSTSSPATT